MVQNLLFFFVATKTIRNFRKWPSVTVGPTKLRPERNEAYALKSEDFQSPTFYGEQEDGNVKCLNYKLTHYYRDSSANWLENK